MYQESIDQVMKTCAEETSSKRGKGCQAYHLTGRLGEHLRLPTGSLVAMVDSGDGSARNLMLHLAQTLGIEQQVPTAYLSLRETADDTIRRILAARTKTPLDVLMSEGASNELMWRLEEEALALKASSLDILFPRSTTAPAIADMERPSFYKNDPVWLFVEGKELMGSNEGVNEWVALKRLALSINAVVVVEHRAIFSAAHHDTWKEQVAVGVVDAVLVIDNHRTVRNGQIGSGCYQSEAAVDPHHCSRAPLYFAFHPGSKSVSILE